MERIDTVVVGGGQAGLAVSRELSRRGREHVVLERARIAERWRTQRWDSLRFQFPNWSIELPGSSFASADPDAFATKGEVVTFLETYAESIGVPLRAGVEVRGLHASSRPDRYVVSTSDGAFESRNVVVATGPYQRAREAPPSVRLHAGIVQVHASEYRHPGALPPGAVLVVGSGASGCQIAEELLESGRPVVLAVGRHRCVPRRYRGRDVFAWRRTLGELDRTVEETPGEHRLPPPLVTGVGGGHTVDLDVYARNGMMLVGRIVAADGTRVALDTRLDADLAEGDRTFNAFLADVDRHVARTGEACEPPDVDPRPPRFPRAASPEQLDLRAEGVTSVVWSTGYRFDFGWIGLPIVDADGGPMHRRGVTAAPGVFFLGLPWMRKMKSSFLCGVGEDAAYLAEQIAAR